METGASRIRQHMGRGAGNAYPLCRSNTLYYASQSLCVGFNGNRSFKKIDRTWEGALVVIIYYADGFRLMFRPNWFFCCLAGFIMFF